MTLKSLGEGGLMSSERLNDERFDKIRALVAKLDSDPDDDDTAEVVMDFCAEIGFREIAEKIHRGKELNERGRRQLRVMAVNSLRVLFGDSEHDPSEAMYTSVVGLPRSAIFPADTVVITAQSYVSFQARKVVLEVLPRSQMGQDMMSYVMVEDVKIGRWSLMCGNDPVPATIFAVSHVPIIPVRVTVEPNTTLAVTVRNDANIGLTVYGCILGFDRQALTFHADPERTAERIKKLEDDLAKSVLEAKFAFEAHGKLEKRLDMLEAVFTKKSER